MKVSLASQPLSVAQWLDSQYAAPIVAHLSRLDGGVRLACEERHLPGLICGNEGGGWDVGVIKPHVAFRAQ
ncbi:hypothetical protein SERLADRAFT_454465, partial [Serpula lacrymans var. lacrymans S7.9]